MGEPIAYSIPGAAAAIGVSEGHIRKELERGNLGKAKAGSRTIIPRAELLRYVEANFTPAPAANAANVFANKSRRGPTRSLAESQ